ncbi:hypothetical protein T01_1316 [Trichinella spiralis]|uniref:Uncharacterized protein n=1 Tax=Trichinella spiralis TaxID=6334 RepID=A0A0V1B1L7_TRISP|nr:hypothetical protein T01_1316 [Trichinella spiralis]
MDVVEKPFHNYFLLFILKTNSVNLLRSTDMLALRRMTATKQLVPILQRSLIKRSEAKTVASLAGQDQPLFSRFAFYAFIFIFPTSDILCFNILKIADYNAT